MYFLNEEMQAVPSASTSRLWEPGSVTPLWPAEFCLWLWPSQGAGSWGLPREGSKRLSATLLLQFYPRFDVEFLSNFFYRAFPSAASPPDPFLLDPAKVWGLFKGYLWSCYREGPGDAPPAPSSLFPTAA